jgi:hypothetical protein
MAIEAVTGDVIPAPVAPATPPLAPSQPPGATADLAMTPAEQTRAERQALKQDPDWLKRYNAGDLQAHRQLQQLQLKEHQQLEAQNALRFGGPSAQDQRNAEAETLRSMGVSEAVVEHYRIHGTVSAEEHRRASAMWDQKKRDPAYKQAHDNHSCEAKQQLALMQIIRSSRIDPNIR